MNKPCLREADVVRLRPGSLYWGCHPGLRDKVGIVTHTADADGACLVTVNFDDVEMFSGIDSGMFAPAELAIPGIEAIMAQFLSEAADAAREGHDYGLSGEVLASLTDCLISRGHG